VLPSDRFESERDEAVLSWLDDVWKLFGPYVAYLIKIGKPKKSEDTPGDADCLRNYLTVRWGVLCCFKLLPQFPQSGLSLLLGEERSAHSIGIVTRWGDVVPPAESLM
jgi:hypothetical protein